MSDKILKTFKGIVKGVSEKDFTLDVIVSTDSIDRDKEKIELTAFKKRLGHYKEHPVLLVNHDRYSITSQIGKAESVKITSDGVLVKFKYFVGEGNEQADWAWLLANKGMAAFSIGFIAHAYVDNNRDEAEKTGYWRKYTEVELIEISQVTVPSNRDAVQRRLTDAEGLEKEMCELVVAKGLVIDKDVAPESETTPEDKFAALEAQVMKNAELLAQIGNIADEIDGKLRDFLASDDLASKIKEVLVQEKHYSKQLFSGASEKVTVEQPQQSDVMSAVSKAIKEALGK